MPPLTKISIILSRAEESDPFSLTRFLNVVISGINAVEKSGSSTSSSLSTFNLKKEWFRSNNNPQPSPVFPSAPIAPRWVMLVSPKIDFFTSFLDLLPFLCAIKPKPQLSFSRFGSYKDLVFMVIGR